MAEDNICQEFRLKTVDEKKCIEEIDQYESISKTQRKVCTVVSNVVLFCLPLLLDVFQYLFLPFHLIFL